MRWDVQYFLQKEVVEYVDPSWRAPVFGAGVLAEAIGDFLRGRQMKEHELRVVEERDVLVEKIGKLKAFINLNKVFEGLPVAEQRRLEDQCRAMCRYRNILNDRIENF